MRIPTLLQKISELTSHPERCTTIDIDLMLDYTRVLYADLLEWREKLAATAKPAPARPLPSIDEPTLTEMAEAMEAAEESEMPVASEAHLPVTQSQPQRFATQQPAASPDILRLQQAAPKDIRTLIGINDKYRIISELFGNDKAEYEEALDYVHSADSEESALKWLRERLWVAEEHSDAAQDFYDLVRRFKNVG